MSDVNPRGFKPVAADYFQRRSLTRFAGIWSLGALAISIVIPGEFSGWNYGLIQGGFGGLLIATLVTALMYSCLVVSLAELSTAMPFTGGGYAFARAALGRWAGYLTGVAQNIEFIMIASAVVVSVGETAKVVLSEGCGINVPAPVIWVVTYTLFTAINIYGIELTCRVALLLTVVALAALAIFAVIVAPSIDLRLALDVPIAERGTAWLPHGLSGIAWALPFAVWFLVGVEMITLTPEEALDPTQSVPRGLFYSTAILIFAALVVLFANSAIPPGAQAIGGAQEPLILGLRTVLGGGNAAWIAILVMSGYVAGFHAEIYGYGRGLFALARAGYLPSALALTHPTRKTPHFALLAGSGFGLGITLLLHMSSEHIDAILVNMAVYAAIVSYIPQMLAYLILRRRFHDMERPFSSPFGATGAMTALLLSICAGALMLFYPAYREAMYGCLIIFAIAVLYYWVSGRHRIVAAPEEVFAATLSVIPAADRALVDDAA